MFLPVIEKGATLVGGSQQLSLDANDLVTVFGGKLATDQLR